MNPARAQLDNTVVNIELTLASIIQGVALYFLTDNARGVLAPGNWVAALYVAAALCIIFIFWSRSIIHTLTLIRWPIEFGHNFFYIACALGEALLFSRLSQPTAWFMLSALYAFFVWLLFIYDMRLLRARRSEARSGADVDLYDLVARDQQLNIRWLLPAMIIFNLGGAAMLFHASRFGLGRHLELWLAIAQLASFVGYLAYVMRFWHTLAPVIIVARDANES